MITSAVLKSTYVGQAKNMYNRIKQEIHDALKNRDHHIHHNATTIASRSRRASHMAKTKIENYAWIIIKHSIDKSDLNTTEKYFIKAWRPDMNNDKMSRHFRNNKHIF